MKITEKKLLDNYIGIANDGDFISKISGIEYYWHYTAYYYDDNADKWVIDRTRSEIKYQTYSSIYKSIETPERCMNLDAYKAIERRFNREMESLFKGVY